MAVRAFPDGEARLRITPLLARFAPGTGVGAARKSFHWCGVGGANDEGWICGEAERAGHVASARIHRVERIRKKARGARRGKGDNDRRSTEAVGRRSVFLVRQGYFWDSFSLRWL